MDCPFYKKIGACRHGSTCARAHNTPRHSQTILLTNFYHNPKHQTLIMKGQVIENAPKFSDEEEQKHFDDVFEELYMELEDEYGQIDELNICQNLGRHLYGNVYVKFRKSESADKALMSINNRWFDQRPINAELSPVVDFRAACCPQYEEGNCERGNFCNFMHLKPISKEAKNRLTQFMIEREFDRKSRHKRRKHKRSKKRYSSSSSNSSSSDSSRSSSGSRKSFRGSRKRSRSSNSTVSGRSTPSYGRGRSVKSAEKSEHRSSLEKYIIDDMIGEAPSTKQNQKIAKDGDTDLKKYPSSVNQNSGNHARVENKNLPLLNQYFDSAEDST